MNPNRNDIVMKRPASTFPELWRDATPLGNGLTGALVYGAIAVERIIISRHDLWHEGKDGNIPDVSDSFRKMRELGEAGNYEDACNLMFDALNENNYGTNLATMRTLGMVSIKADCNGVFSDYSRILHMDSGEAEIRCLLDNGCIRRRAFVSRKSDIIVYQIETDFGENYSVSCGFFDSEEQGSNNVRQKDGATAVRAIIDGHICYSVKNDDGSFFGIVCKAKTDGTAEFSDGRLNISGAKRLTVFIKAFSGEKTRSSAVEKNIRLLDRSAGEYNDIFKAHCLLHRRLYNAADIALYHGRTYHSNEELLAGALQNHCSPELAEKLWRFGRYLFISGTNKNGNPFPLYGLWTGGYFRPWTQNVANENVQSIYWHANVGGLSEQIPALIHYYYGKMPVFREAAKKLFGCGGIFVSTYTTPFNSTPAPHVPVILHFNSVAGWLSRHFYDYYLYSGDRNLLEKEILPFMTEAAQFYEDYLQYDENGKAYIYPAVSPENTPEQYLGVKRPTTSGHPMPVTKNPLIEIAVIKDLLTNLVTLSDVCDIPAEKAKKWKQILASLPEYRINDDGAAAEWLPEDMRDNYFHRHLSHLYPVFPGNEIFRKDRSYLLPAFSEAVNRRKLGSFSGWALSHMSCIYARLGDDEKSYSMIDMLSKVCLNENLFTLSNDYRNMGITTTGLGDTYFAPVQFDALLGCVNAIQEMIMTVGEDRIIVLPACPSQFGHGKADRLRFPGGEISITWDLSRYGYKLKIKAVRDIDTIIVLPFGNGEQNLIMKKGETIVLEKT